MVFGFMLVTSSLLSASQSLQALRYKSFFFGLLGFLGFLAPRSMQWCDNGRRKQLGICGQEWVPGYTRAGSVTFDSLLLSCFGCRRCNTKPWIGGRYGGIVGGIQSRVDVELCEVCC